MSPIELSLGPYGALCGCYTQFSIGLYRILAGHEKKFAVAAYLLYPYFFIYVSFAIIITTKQASFLTNLKISMSIFKTCSGIAPWFCVHKKTTTIQPKYRLYCLLYFITTCIIDTLVKDTKLVTVLRICLLHS